MRIWVYFCTYGLNMYLLTYNRVWVLFYFLPVGATEKKLKGIWKKKLKPKKTQKIETSKETYL
jgi:hypothetical protein